MSTNNNFGDAEHGDIRQFDVFTDDMSKTFLAGQVYGRASALKAQVTGALVSFVVSGSMDAKKRISTMLRYKLSEAQKRKLQDAYATINIQFADYPEEHQHPMAASSRTLNTIMLYRKVSMFENVLDVGGNYLTHVMDRRMNVHSCTPILDLRDSGRDAERVSKLVGTALHLKKKIQKMTDQTAIMKAYERALCIESLVKNPLKFRCHKNALECDHKADVGISVHANYDINLVDTARIMVKHGLREYYGAILFSDVMFISDRGVLGTVEVEYRVDVARSFGQCGCSMQMFCTQCERRMIRFSFLGDNSLSYTHNYDEYMKYGVDHVVKVDGRSYAYTVEEKCADTLMFKMIPIPNAVEDDLPKKYLISQFLPARVHLRTYRHIKGMPYNRMIGYEEVSVAVPEQQWNQIMDYTATQTDDLDRTNVYNYVRSINARVVINGTVLMAAEKIADVDIDPFVTAVMFFSAVRRYCEVWHTTLFVNDQMLFRQIASGSMISMVKHIISEAFFGESSLVMSTLGKIRDTLHKYVSSLVGFDCDYSVGFDILEVTKPGQSLFSDILPHWLKVDEEVPCDAFDWPDMDKVSEEATFKLEFDDADMEELLGTFDSDLMCDFKKFTGCDATTPSVSRSTSVSHTHVDSDPEHDMGSPCIIDGLSDTTERMIPLVGNMTITPMDMAHTVLKAAGGKAIPLLKRVETESEKRKQLPMSTTSNYAINSMRELVNYSNGLIEGIEAQCESFSNSLRLLDWKTSIRSVRQVLESLVDQEVGVIVLSRGRVTEKYGTVVGKYMAVYDPRSHTIVEATYDGDEVVYGTISGPVVVYSDLAVYLSPRIRDGVLRTLKKVGDHYEPPHTHLIEGVAGAGKTYAITHSVDVEEDMVICYTREGRVDILDTLNNMHGGDYHKRVRTIDSVLINGKVPGRIGALFIDEGLMAHAGALYAAIAYLKPKCVKIYGDTVQIPFISRNHMTLLYGEYDHVSERTYMNVSRRCPADVAAILDGEYKNGMLTRTVNPDDPVIYSLNSQRISSKEELQYDERRQYLTYIQADKAELRKMGFSNTITVHEAQGKTYRSVALVRLNASSYSVFDSKPHNVVALSRHTHDFTFYNITSKPSLMAKWLSRELSVSTLTKFLTK